MRYGFTLLILFLLALASGCAEQHKVQLAPRHVCEMIDRINEIEGQRVVVQGILSWVGRHGTVWLLDCRGTRCPDRQLLIRWASKETRSPMGVDDSYDRMMNELEKQNIHEVIATLEGTIRVENDLFSHPSLNRKMIVLDLPRVKSVKPVPVGQERSNYCE